MHSWYSAQSTQGHFQGPASICCTLKTLSETVPYPAITGHRPALHNQTQAAFLVRLFPAWPCNLSLMKQYSNSRLWAGSNATSRRESPQGEDTTNQGNLPRNIHAETSPLFCKSLLQNPCRSWPIPSWQPQRRQHRGSPGAKATAPTDSSSALVGLDQAPIPHFCLNCKTFQHHLHLSTSTIHISMG